MAFSLLRLGARSSFGIIEKHLNAVPVAVTALNGSSGIGGPSGFGAPRSAALRQCLPTVSVRHFADRSRKGRTAEYESDSDSDSDSDRECKGKHRGESNFWRRKMRTLHGILDVNNDGVLSYDDFLLLTDRFTALGHLTPKESDDFRETMKRTWEEQWGEVSPYNLVTVEKYLEEMHHALNDKSLKRKVHHFLPHLFKGVDKDKSGFITVDEFKLFFECLGLCQDAAAVSFAIIDTNGDGQLSMTEFVKLGKDFFLTENEKKISRMFWGPLVEH